MPEADRSGLSATVAAAQEDPDSLPPEINTNVAHSARVYNYWLGGKDNFAADRALGDAIIKAVPSTVFGARANRAFLGRAVRYLATAFVLAHPAVTSVLTGPRTMDHLTAALAGADVRLGQGVLDKIDEIVAPGAEINPADNYITIPALADKNLRRRR